MLSWALIKKTSCDTEFSYIPIDQASFTKKEIYYCPECFSEVRPRKCFFKRAHFFHLYTQKRSCRAMKKKKVSRLHLDIQQYIKARLERDYRIFTQSQETVIVELEKVFHGINRIADVAFLPLKIVFEVQVSPIEPSELLQRTINYWEFGWHVIWILFDQTFSPERDFPLKNVLEISHIPHYYVGQSRFTGSLFLYDFKIDKTSQKRIKKIFTHLRPILITDDVRSRRYRLYKVLSHSVVDSFKMKGSSLERNMYERDWTIYLDGDLSSKEEPYKQSESIAMSAIERLLNPKIEWKYSILLVCRYTYRWWLSFLSKW